jgi:small ligand-binding sensory domain FIST
MNAHYKETSGPHFAAALSTRPSLHDALTETTERVLGQLGGSADLAVTFLSPDYADDWDRLPTELADRLGTERILGCSGAGVIGTGREVEEGPALSLWAARVPDIDVLPVALNFHRTSEGGVVVGWPDELVGAWPDDGTLLLLADPFSFPADYLLERINDEHPGTPVIGGMASGGTVPGQHRLFLGTQPHKFGAVGWLVRGPIRVRSLVSQGCRPIGEKLIVTSAERNLIHELGGKPALEQLQRIYRQLPTHEQELLQRGLHIGRVVSEYQDEFAMGDFLVRNVLGVDHESGTIAVGDFLRPGQTVQFHLREEKAASAELDRLLAEHASAASVQAALLFTCNGRGSHLFSAPHHDAALVARRLGDIPLAGFFAQGEIGPVGGISFLHGFTASLALFTK